MISVKNLSKVYDTGTLTVTALRGVSFKIKKGEFVAIMGPSGSGKSTLMNMLGCLDLPTTGNYRLEDLEISSLKPNQLAEVRNRRIGFVFQSFNLLPRATALENTELPLLYGRVSNSTEIAMNALERVGLKHRANHKPTELSGGEKQRVAIARALVNQPAIILADEPTGNLDSETGEDIMSLFLQLNKENVTLILVTHEEEIALKAQRIIKMKDGRIIKDHLLEATPC
ncbi:MAG: ABC transporter ATP-binding protein [Nitrospinae bacterium]|nr:ABC transporter ATP-binding protein [Nitrospinota bacterium]MZH05184.1 ABC transporter ATP-binding protein [Nitrospinota bacterium]MZH15596.1 ABC transporter ATP-binding protein [Nitrospinota bacterium]